MISIIQILGIFNVLMLMGWCSELNISGLCIRGIWLCVREQKVMGLIKKKNRL